MTATVKLPVWATVFAAWRYLATQWRIVLPLAVFLLLTGPAFVFWQPVLGQVSDIFGSMPYLRMFVVTALTDMPMFALVAVAIIPLHRAILTGPPQPGARIPFRLGRREARYFLLVAAITVVYAGLELAMLRGVDWSIAAVLNLVLKAEQTSPVLDWFLVSGKTILILVTIAAFIYFSIRLSLTLPAIATDHEGALSHAWTISRGNGWRLVAVLWIAILPVIIAVIVLQLPGDAELSGPILIDDTSIRRPMGFGDSVYFITVGFWAALMYTVSYLIEGAALSMSYRALGGLDERA